MEQSRPPLTATTIAAIATPPGTGGVALIRVSGPDAIKTVAEAWRGKDLTSLPSRTVTLGTYADTKGNNLDQALATVFRAPNSFTGQDVVEITLHGSRWIQTRVLADLLARGISMAAPGEFTQRAFLNGRIDLAQAEGIADLIAASSRAAHKLALSQTKGSYSRRLDQLRQKLLHFASLLELELDFAEEDVEFADREELLQLADTAIEETQRLADSYSRGAAIKDGFNIVIAGVPNAGKSSLLNLLLQDDKAIVSDIPGTTRDIIEDTAEINGTLFRFIDTAGLRTSSDTVEKLGIEKARAKMPHAHAVVWMFDTTAPLDPQNEQLRSARQGAGPDVPFIFLANKSDLRPTTTPPATQTTPLPQQPPIPDETAPIGQSSPLTDDTSTPTRDMPGLLPEGTLAFSTRTSEGLDSLKQRLLELTPAERTQDCDVVITNARHHQALEQTARALRRAADGIRSGLSADFTAQDVREALHHLGTITGAVTAPDILHRIFSHFCIGK